MTRNLYISTKYAQEAVKDSAYMEAMAFALLIKFRYVTSVVYDSRIRSLSANLGIGYRKLSRIIKEAQALGFIEITASKAIKACKMHGDDNYAVRWRLKENHKYTFKEVVDIIRIVAGYNHLNKIADTESTIYSATDPNTTSELKRARTKLKKQKHPLKESHYDYCSLSKLEIVMNVSRKTVVRLVKKMVELKLVEKVKHISKAGRKIMSSVSEETYNFWHKQFGFRGHVFYGDKQAFVQYCNSYTICDKSTSRWYKKAK